MKEEWRYELMMTYKKRFGSFTDVIPLVSTDLYGAHLELRERIKKFLEDNPDINKVYWKLWVYVDGKKVLSAKGKFDRKAYILEEPKKGGGVV